MGILNVLDQIAGRTAFPYAFFRTKTAFCCQRFLRLREESPNVRYRPAFHSLDCNYTLRNNHTDQLTVWLALQLNLTAQLCTSTKLGLLLSIEKSSGKAEAFAVSLKCAGRARPGMQHAG